MPKAGVSQQDWAKASPAQKRFWAKSRNGKSKPLDKVAKDALPPHSETDERAALGCVLIEADK